MWRAEIRTVPDYVYAPKVNMNGITFIYNIVLKLRVKQVTYESNIE